MTSRFDESFGQCQTKASRSAGHDEYLAIELQSSNVSEERHNGPSFVPQTLEIDAAQQWYPGQAASEQ